MINRKIRLRSIFDFFWLLLVYYFLFFPGVEKYILVTSIMIIILIKAKKIKSGEEVRGLLYPFLFYIFFGIGIGLIKSNISVYTFKQALFILSPFFFVVSLYSHNSTERFAKVTDLTFWAISIAFIVNMSSNFNSIDLFESTYAFPIGLYVIYFMFRKSHFKFLIALILAILAHKRIAIGALVLTIVFYFVLEKLNKKIGKKVALVAFIVFSSFVFLYIFSIQTHIIDSFVQRFQINTQGRLYTYHYFDESYKLSYKYLGQGLGFVLNTLKNMYIKNLHNDFLSMYIEIGFIGLLIFILIYYKYIKYVYEKCDYKCASAVITIIFYTFILYLTDNVSIYISYLIPYFTIILNLISSDQYDRYSIESSEKLKNIIDI